MNRHMATIFFSTTIGVAALGQQYPQTQPTQNTAPPCLPAKAQPTSRIIGRIHIPIPLRGTIAKACEKLGTCVDDPNKPLALPAEAKPCPVAPVPTTPPVPKQPDPETLKIEFMSEEYKTAYVCPLNTTFTHWILPQCETPDHETVDLIKIPIYSPLKPAPQQKPAAPATQK